RLRLCKCPCATHLNYSHQIEKATESSTQMIAQLSISKDSLSARVRRRTSAANSWPSSVGAGVTAIILMASVFIGLAITDITATGSYMWTKLSELVKKSSHARQNQKD
ncbi:hypothetical protein EGW08_000766, partial [Elysia chlorotica]